MKIGIAGNCQAEGLGLSLQSWVPGLETFVGTVPLHDQSAQAALRQSLLDCDYILLQSVEYRNAQFLPFISSILDVAAERVERFPVVVFNGFHPDSIYVVRDGVAVDGPLGSYHSALATAAWFEGLSEARAAALFNAYSYASLGYFNAFEAASGYLRSEAMSGYDLTSCTRLDRVFMHTINHPSIEVSAEIARQALDRLAIHRRAAIDLPVDPLAAGVVWPLYPEIAERLGVRSDSHSPDFLQIVAANYAALNTAAAGGPKETLTSGGSLGASAIGRARSFIRSEVI